MLRGSRRSGFTLVEIIVATAASLIVSGAVYRVLLATIRLSRAQASHFAVQSTTRGALLAVSAELRELSGADLLSVAPGAVTYRAMRGTGFTCQASSPDRVQMRSDGFSGHRDPQPGRDSALIYVDSAGSESEAAWVPVGITHVSQTSCPGGLGSGFTLAVTPADALAGAPVGTPVRIYEIVELRRYQSEGKTWLGMRSVSAGEAIQPLFGPLHETEGFQLAYLDARGKPALNPAIIQSVLVTVRATADGAIDGRLTARVALRNAPS
jgi:prepilin-type N-terminal cleavage/methylation domain-containing protein